MKREDIKVSIIVAVYNVERYLSKCIESLVGQTYQNLEIILVDDGSSDNSAVICDEWQETDSRIVVYHQINSGVSTARNKGILSATGKYVIFVDSDDWLDKLFVERLIENQNDGGVVLTGYVIDYDNLRESHHVEKRYSKDNVCCLEKEKVVSLFQAGLFSPIWNKLYERSHLLKKNIKFRENMNLGEDIVFNLEYFRELKGSFRIINEPLYHYTRCREVSLTGCYNENYMEQQKIIYRYFIECVKGYPLNTVLITQLYCLYFDALVTGIDNLYVNKKDMDLDFFHSKMSERRRDPEFIVVLNEIKGRDKIIYKIRYFLVRKGGYVWDFYLRKSIKRIFRLE